MKTINKFLSMKIFLEFCLLSIKLSPQLFIKFKSIFFKLRIFPMKYVYVYIIAKMQNNSQNFFHYFTLIYIILSSRSLGDAPAAIS